MEKVKSVFVVATPVRRIEAATFSNRICSVSSAARIALVNRLRALLIKHTTKVKK